MEEVRIAVIGGGEYPTKKFEDLLGMHLETQEIKAEKLILLGNDYNESSIKSMAEKNGYGYQIFDNELDMIKYAVDEKTRSILVAFENDDNKEHVKSLVEYANHVSIWRAYIVKTLLKRMEGEKNGNIVSEETNGEEES